MRHVVASAAVSAGYGNHMVPAPLVFLLHGVLFPFGPRYQQLVEPLDMGSEHTHHHAHVEHGDERADAYHGPVPTAEVGEHEYCPDGDEQRVGAYLYLAEVAAGKPGDGKREALARQHEGIAAHLKGYAEGEYAAAEQ